jgi:hypothetical protein
MKKVLIALSLVASFSAMAGNGIGGLCGNGATVGQTVDFEGNTYKVQWITKSGPDCKPGVDQFKLVYVNEYIAPAVFEANYQEGSFGKGILMGLLGAHGMSTIEGQKIKTKNCLVENNFQAKSCFPKSDFEIANEECFKIGFQANTIQHQQCAMSNLQSIRQNNAIKEAAESQAAEMRRIVRQQEHNAFMNNLQQQTQNQQQVYQQGYRNYDCRARLGGRVECTGF